MRKYALAVAVATLLLTGLGSAASAASIHNGVPLVRAPVAPANVQPNNASGCSGYICEQIKGSGTYVTTINVNSTYLWTGHVWIHDSMGHLSYNTPHYNWYWRNFLLTLDMTFPAGDRLCATAYDENLNNKGAPCETIG